MAPPSLYLVNPRCDHPTYFGAEVHAAHGFEPAVLLADAALPTVAALAPPDFDVTLCDEAISPVDLDTPARYVGFTGKISQETRMIELALEYRRRGKTVIFGGPYASLSPERLRPYCDILVRGELEDIAGEFFDDLRSGNWRPEYAGGKPELRNSPAPRWDLYPNHRAVTATVQTSRGCPFECEFCDVIQYLGRKQRHKTPHQVLAELDVLYAYGHRAVFLADDNLTVHRARAKELLVALAEWNRTRPAGRVGFSTQVSIDCTRDPELLKLCADAGVSMVFVGIESPNADSLKETKKRQNLGVDMAERLIRFAEHGILVTGGMMLGFDADTPAIFQQQYEFAMSLPVPMFTVTPLSAPAATPLYARMSAEQRLIDPKAEAPAAFPWTTNLIPKQMTRAELVDGVRWLCNRLYRPVALEHRLARLIDAYRPPALPSVTASAPPPTRKVDAERAAIVAAVGRLGPAEAAMAGRINLRLQRKPEARTLAMLALGYYMQVRHVYESSGLWNPDLGRQAEPFQGRKTSPLVLALPILT